MCRKIEVKFVQFEQRACGREWLQTQSICYAMGKNNLLLEIFQKTCKKITEILHKQDKCAGEIVHICVNFFYISIREQKACRKM